MKTLKNALFCAAGAMLFASTAQAQTWVFDDVIAAEGSATVDVPWTFTAGGGAQANSVDVSFGGILTGVDLTDCLLVENSDLAACNDIGGGVVRIAFTGLGNPVGDANGILRFTLDGAAVDGDSAPVDAEPAPGGSDVPPIITDGSVTVQGVTAILNVTPATINFGNQQTGTTSGPQTVTVSNDGTDGIDLTLSAINFTGDFSQSGGSCTPTSVLADGASCTIDVVFSPTVDGAAAGSVVVVSDAATVTNDTVTLDGQGVPGPQSTLTVTPDPMAFGVVDLGAMPATDTFIAENTGAGGSSLTISAVALATGAEFTITSDGCTGTTLNAGDTCSVGIQFNSAVNGVFADTATFTSDANNNPTPAIAITGEADSTAVLAVNPPFGPVNLGFGPAGSTVSANGSLSNSGSADGAFSCSLGGPDAAVFSTNPAPLAGTVTAGGSVPFSISCNIPTSGLDGDTYSATLTCTSADDANFNGTHDLSCGVANAPALPVPTMQPWALVLFGMLMLMVGGLSIRFFRG
ncbi:choice-of-anchor D domain-containing protein [Wenzhouxiangella marina]|uniref:HYDIN/VesB/CFA65-like Ig-like domain-containing protein n=1 Tax=Wenzhouxiangella marina TaxID=1579979 RepID=A0A0K0XTP3_9GAMM|nr:choice-of-anchor D domain-containing protein [Wenzhouxiangella marina]AKS41053.1 hypothetical protein WM2015_672 [Wenzhouxiangella marina]MBB6087931.1 hypothetical protein [Wenzhouxiangella marina]